MKHNCKKLLAVLLSMLMLILMTLPTVFAAIDSALLGSDIILQSENEYTLIGGVTEYDLILNNAAGDHRNRVYVMEVDPANPNVEIVAGYNDGDGDGWGRIPVREQAEAYEEKYDTNVIGAINGDFHNQETGEPRGALFMRGVQYHSAGGYNYFAILKNGKAVIRYAGTSTADVKEAIGGASMLIWEGDIVAYVNKLNPRTAIGIKKDGTVVMFVVDGRQDPNSCGMDYPEVAQAMLALGCEYALELDGGGSSTFLAQHEGRSRLDCRNNPSYGYERDCSTSLFVTTSLKATGEFARVDFSASEYICAPVSSVSIVARGVDTNGYPIALPEGGKIVLENNDLGKLDGGKFTAGSDEGEVTVQYVLDGEVIASATIIVTNEADNAIESIFTKIRQFFYDIINTFKLLIDKFNEKILGKG